MALEVTPSHVKDGEMTPELIEKDAAKTRFSFDPDKFLVSCIQIGIMQNALLYIGRYSV